MASKRPEPVQSGVRGSHVTSPPPPKKTRFKSQESAEARVRLLEKRLQELDAIATRYSNELKQQRKLSLLLAKLAAKGPAFFNPLEALDAERCRDLILSQNGMNPDGSCIRK